MLDGTSCTNNRQSLAWRRYTIGLVVLLTAFRIVYLACFCPLDLAPDEAHYWDWSRHLDWSYYSKGPLVAWLIRLGCELFGPLSLQLTGSEVMAVRLPAVICGALLLIGLTVLTKQISGSDQLAFYVVLATAFQPIITAGSVLMTIDSPFACLWTWALVCAHYAVVHESRWAWPTTGLLIGLGILAKYTMGLWLLSFVLFLLFTPTYRYLLVRSGFWVMVLVAFVSTLPILYWNYQNEWVTFRHVARQAGIQTAKHSAGLRWLGPFEYLGGQFALLLGYAFVAWVCAMVVFRPTRERDPRIRYLWWMSAPTFLFFGAASLKAPGQINWPIATYLSGIVLMVFWLSRALQSPDIAYRRLSRIGATAAFCLCFFVTIVSMDTRLIRPLLVEVAQRIKKDDQLAIRAVDPTCRLRGFKHLGVEIDAVRGQVRTEEARDPIVAGANWSMIGEIGFYCQGHPDVVSLGPYFGDRRSQYDIWRPNPIADIQAFSGRTFLVVASHETTLRQAFADVKQAKEVIYRENNVAVASWRIWVCRDYKGINMPNTRSNDY